MKFLYLNSGYGPHRTPNIKVPCGHLVQAVAARTAIFRAEKKERRTPRRKKERACKKY
jgi:hypothetical protein